MPSLRITPWEHPDALVELGELFYKDGAVQTDDGLLHQGCDLADAYSRRGPLPHAIAATTGLARAVLAERCLAPSASSSGTRLQPSTASHAITALYATAFAAFVTGYLDNKQTGAAKRTMYELAAEIGMPPSFVARRHAIIHEGYAGFRELRRVSIDGLKWLWESYWAEVLAMDGRAEPSDDDDDDVGPDKDAQAKASKILTEQVAAWAAQTTSAGPRRNQIVPQIKRLDASAVAMGMVQASGLRSTEHQSAAILDILLREEAMLAPFTSPKAERQYIAKWAPLLTCLAAQLKPKFTSLLTKTLWSRLLEPDSHEHQENRSKRSRNQKADTKNQPQLSESTANAILAWVRFLCNNPAWIRLIRKAIPLDELARPCGEHPGPYSTVLAVTLVRSRLWNTAREHAINNAAEVENLEALVKELTNIPGSSHIQDNEEMEAVMATPAYLEDRSENMDIDHSDQV